MERNYITGVRFALKFYIVGLRFVSLLLSGTRHTNRPHEFPYHTMCLKCGGVSPHKLNTRGYLVSQCCGRWREFIAMKNKYVNWYPYRMVVTPALLPGTSPTREQVPYGPGHLATEDSETCMCGARIDKLKMLKKTSSVRNIEICVTCAKAFKAIEYPPVE